MSDTVLSFKHYTSQELKTATKLGLSCIQGYKKIVNLCLNRRFSRQKESDKFRIIERQITKHVEFKNPVRKKKRPPDLKLKTTHSVQLDRLKSPTFVESTGKQTLAKYAVRRHHTQPVSFTPAKNLPDIQVYRTESLENFSDASSGPKSIKREHSFDQVMSELLEKSHEVNHWNPSMWPTMVEKIPILQEKVEQAKTSLRQERTDKNNQFYNQLIDEMIKLIDQDVQNQRDIDLASQMLPTQDEISNFFKTEATRTIQTLVSDCETLGSVNKKWRSLSIEDVSASRTNSVQNLRLLNNSSSTTFQSTRSDILSDFRSREGSLAEDLNEIHEYPESQMSKSRYYSGNEIYFSEDEGKDHDDFQPDLKSHDDLTTCMEEEEDSGEISSTETIVYDDTDQPPAPDDYPLQKYSILLVHQVLEASKFSLIEAVEFDTSNNSTTRYRSKIDKIIVKIRKVPDFNDEFVKFTLTCLDFNAFTRTIILDPNKTTQKIFFKVPSITQMKRKKFENLTFRITSVLDINGHKLATPADFQPKLVDDFPYFGMKMKEIKLDLAELKKNYLEFPVRNCYKNNFKSNIGLFENQENFNSNFYKNTSSVYSSTEISELSSVESLIISSTYSSSADEEESDEEQSTTVVETDTGTQSASESHFLEHRRNKSFTESNYSLNSSGIERDLSSGINSLKLGAKNEISDHSSNPKTRMLKVIKSDLLKSNTLKLYPGGHSLKLKIANSSKLFIEEMSLGGSNAKSKDSSSAITLTDRKASDKIDFTIDQTCNSVQLKLKKVGFGRTKFHLLFDLKDKIQPLIDNYIELTTLPIEMSNNHYVEEKTIDIKFNLKKLLQQKQAAEETRKSGEKITNKKKKPSKNQKPQESIFTEDGQLKLNFELRKVEQNHPRKINKKSRENLQILDENSLPDLFEIIQPKHQIFINWVEVRSNSFTKPETLVKVTSQNFENFDPNYSGCDYLFDFYDNF